MATLDDSNAFRDTSDAVVSRVVIDALADGWLSGWDWRREDARRLAALATGTLTFDEYRSEVLAAIDQARNT